MNVSMQVLSHTMKGKTMSQEGQTITAQQKRYAEAIVGQIHFLSHIPVRYVWKHGGKVIDGRARVAVEARNEQGHIDTYILEVPVEWALPLGQSEPSREAHNWLLCLKGDGFDLVEHFPYRHGDRISVETQSVERDEIPCAALLLRFLSDDETFSHEQLPFLSSFLCSRTIFALSESLTLLYRLSSAAKARKT